METKAKAMYMKVSAQKTRLVIDLIRGKKVGTALSILSLSNKAVSKDITTLLKSAVANAENNNNLNIDGLYVKTAYVDEGPTQKRMRPRAMGRGNTILKRSCHMTIILDEAGL